MMREGLVSPIDELSGLPLPIITDYHELRLLAKRKEVSWHHHLFPAHHEVFNTLGGQALRNCRLQLVPSVQHFNNGTGFHSHYDGPPLPTTELEQFKEIVWACAGYIPAYGIDLSRGEPNVRKMTQLEIESLKKLDGYWLNYYSFTFEKAPIIKFFKKYAIETRVEEIDRQEAIQFLECEDTLKRQRLGSSLLNKLIKAATSPVEKEYVEAKDRGLLNKNAPTQACALVKPLAIKHIRHRPQTDTLEVALRAHLGMVEAA